MTSLLGWCVRHIVLIIFAGFVLVGLIYREEIFCIDNEPTGSAETTASEYPEQLQSPGQTLSATPVEHANKTDSDELSSVLETEELQVEITVPEGEEINAEVDAQLEPAEKSLIEEEAGAFSFRSEAGAGGDEPSRSKLKQKARAAYWRGDEEAAVGYYRQLMELRPSDPDAHGELGNILLKQGNREEALGEYRQAVSLLVEQGEKQQALLFVDSVAEEFPGKVQDLRELLESSGSDGD